MVKKQLQLQQCCAVNRGLFRTAHSATGARLEHPLRYLEESSFMVLLQTAPIYDASNLYNCSMNPDKTSTPRMPRITDLSRLRTMGIRLCTCTTRTGLILDWGRIVAHESVLLAQFSRGSKRGIRCNRLKVRPSARACMDNCSGTGCTRRSD
jgi:hypothetical protein